MAVRRSDFLWVFAWPAYQILGTLRHEGAHAVAAIIGGARVTRFVFWPTWPGGGGIWWGYVDIDGPIGWPFLAAPYLFDLLTFALAMGICRAVRFRRRWIWLNVVIVGILSPLVNSALNYAWGLRQPNDVGRLLEALPDAAVHGWFGITLFLYAAGFAAALRAGPRRPPRPRAGLHCGGSTEEVSCRP